MAITWSLFSTFFLLPPGSEGFCSDSVPRVLASSLPPNITVYHAVFGFNSDEFVPRVFPYHLKVSKFLVYAQRNNFCFRSETQVLCVLSHASNLTLVFFLPLFLIVLFLAPSTLFFPPVGCRWHHSHCPGRVFYRFCLVFCLVFHTWSP